MIKELFSRSSPNKIRLSLIVKMVLGFIVTVLLAEFFHLDYVYTAGVIAVLSVESTRQRSLRAALIRIIDSALALGLAMGLFILLGYEFWVLIILVFLFIPLSFLLRVEGGIVVSLVLVSQIYLEQDWRFALNAGYILLIGISISFLMNIYVPKHNRSISRAITSIDQEINTIIQAMASNGEASFSTVKTLMSEASNQLIHDIENNYFVETDRRKDYLEMRKGQLEILERIAPIMHAVPDIPEKRQVQDYLTSFSGKIGTADYATELKNDLDALLASFKASPLPIDRPSFESRAQLYHVLLELDGFLDLKIRYHAKHA